MLVSNLPPLCPPAAHLCWEHWGGPPGSCSLISLGPCGDRAAWLRHSAPLRLLPSRPPHGQLSLLLWQRGHAARARGSLSPADSPSSCVVLVPPPRLRDRCLSPRGYLPSLPLLPLPGSSGNPRGVMLLVSPVLWPCPFWARSGLFPQPASVLCGQPVPPGELPKEGCTVSPDPWPGTSRVLEPGPVVFCPETARPEALLSLPPGPSALTTPASCSILLAPSSLSALSCCSCLGCGDVKGLSPWPLLSFSLGSVSSVRGEPHPCRCLPHLHPPRLTSVCTCSLSSQLVPGCFYPKVQPAPHTQVSRPKLLTPPPPPRTRYPRNTSCRLPISMNRTALSRLCRLVLGAIFTTSLSVTVCLKLGPVPSAPEMRLQSNSSFQAPLIASGSDTNCTIRFYSELAQTPQVKG